MERYGTEEKCHAALVASRWPTGLVCPECGCTRHGAFERNNLKTAFSGAYHAFDVAKYAHRYLAKVPYRFNRRFALSVILARLLRASAVTSPHPERIIHAAEQCG